MTRAEILSMMTGDSDSKHKGVDQDPAFPYFVAAMERRHYGGEALIDAWEWFKDGFMAGRTDAGY